MNVLALLQAAAAEIGIPSPSAYDGNTKLLNILYSVSRELRNTRVFPQQKRKHSFSTSASDALYALPADFYSGLLGTYYNQNDTWQLIGPIGDDHWNYRLYGPGSDSNRFHYRVFGPTIDQYSSSQQMELNPTPSDTYTISYEYITRSLFYQSGWTPTTTVKETASASSDIPMFDDDILIWGVTARYRETRGLDYALPMKLYQQGIDRAKARLQGSMIGRFDNGMGESGRRYSPETDGGWS